MLPLLGQASGTGWGAASRDGTLVCPGRAPGPSGLSQSRLSCTVPHWEEHTVSEPTLRVRHGKHCFWVLINKPTDCGLREFSASCVVSA